MSRSWNGTPISRRTTDGYVNATAMCRANGKRWNDYWRTDRATEYLEALSTETGIPVSKLCLSMKGGAHQGTKYRESDRCQTYLDALAETTGIPMFDLIESRQGQDGSR